MAFKVKDLMQKVFQQPVEFAAQHPPHTGTKAGGPCCHPCGANSEIPPTDTQQNGPCCHMDKDHKDKDDHRLADLTSLRAELRRALPQPPA